MSSLAGRVAMVTGGGRGIGAAVAEALAQAGASVAVADIEMSAAEEVAGRLEPRAAAFGADVADAASVRNAVADVERALGPIDILVTVAALNLNERFVESTGEGWERMLQVNVLGTAIPCHAVLRGMLERSRGRIITFGSDAGKVGSAGSVIYSATKGAVIAFTKSLAREVATRGVTVNCVCPGPTNTPMMQATLADNPKLGDSLTRAIPMKRLAEPVELAAAVTFLAGEEAAFITGQAISVSGGLTMA